MTCFARRRRRRTGLALADDVVRGGVVGVVVVLVVLQWKETKVMLQILLLLLPLPLVMLGLPPRDRGEENGRDGEGVLSPMRVNPRGCCIIVMVP